VDAAASLAPRQCRHGFDTVSARSIQCARHCWIAAVTRALRHPAETWHFFHRFSKILYASMTCASAAGMAAGWHSPCDRESERNEKLTTETRKPKGESK
jgi:hypothetical protein